MQTNPNTGNGTVKVRARLSYVHLLEPYTAQGSNEPKYSTTLLIPKTDTQAKAALDAAIQEAIQWGISNRWNGQQPRMLALPIHDGDGVRQSDGLPFGPECKGMWVMTASKKATQGAPQVVNQRVELITNPSEVYSGMWANVTVRFFAYNNQKKGVGCGLGNVQKVADGEALGGGRTTAFDDFDVVPDESATFAPAPSYSQPAPSYQPQPGYGYPAAQPQYRQTPAPSYPPQQPVQGYGQQPQINPLTGQPMNSGVMGI